MPQLLATDLEHAVEGAAARATLEHPLRSNAVHTLTRQSTGPNVGHRLPIVLCVPADGVTGIEKFVLESIVGAGGKLCPPGSVGVGGAAALETTQIEEIEEVAREELMPECLWRFRVADFGPLTVGIDAHGNSLYHDVQAAATTKLEELYARL